MNDADELKQQLDRIEAQLEVILEHLNEQSSSFAMRRYREAEH